jgi:hypothetical protein
MTLDSCRRHALKRCCGVSSLEKDIISWSFPNEPPRKFFELIGVDGWIQKKGIVVGKIEGR